MKYCVWVSRASEPDEFFEIDNDILSYSCINWDEAMSIFKLSLDQGYTLIMCREEPEAECDDGTPETC